jgi:hypothetical protein
MSSTFILASEKAKNNAELHPLPRKTGKKAAVPQKQSDVESEDGNVAGICCEGVLANYSATQMSFEPDPDTLPDISQLLLVQLVQVKILTTTVISIPFTPCITAYISRLKTRLSPS